MNKGELVNESSRRQRRGHISDHVKPSGPQPELWVLLQVMQKAMAVFGQSSGMFWWTLAEWKRPVRRHKGTGRAVSRYGSEQWWVCCF